MEDDRNRRVAGVVWPWRQRGGDPAADMVHRRKRAAIEALVMLTIGCLIVFVLKKHLILGKIVLGLAGLVFVGGMWVPPVYSGFRKLGAFLAKVIGVSISWILLAPFFYIFFTAGHLIYVISGSDKLERKFDSSKKSYWEPWHSREDVESYERQF